MTYYDPLLDSSVFYCECPFGYGGRKCELQKTECVEGGLVCFHGGTCKAKNPNAEFQSDVIYECACPAGFEGPHCERKVMKCSDSLTCFNGGVCKNSTTPTPLGHFCDCPSGFEGALCQIKVEKCSENLSCYNNGQCLYDEQNGYYCQCNSRFGGNRCELPKVECKGGLISCLNGGWCVDEDDTDPNSLQKCECKPGFEGVSCQLRKTSSEKEAESLPTTDGTKDTVNQNIVIKDQMFWASVALVVPLCFLFSFFIIIIYIRKHNKQAVVLTYEDKGNRSQEAFVMEDVQSPSAAHAALV